MRCMHTRPHRRKDQLPLRSLRDLRSRYVFAPVQPRLARWNISGPKGGRGALEGMGHIRGTFSILYHFLVLDLKRFICFPISCVFHVSEKKLGEVTKVKDVSPKKIRRSDQTR